MKIKTIVTFFSITAFLVVHISCNQTINKTSLEKINKECSNDVQLKTEKKIFISVDSLLAKADHLSGQTITVQGLVDHVCRHSAKRFKIINNDGSKEIKIVIGSNMPIVEQSIEGKIAEVTGILVPEQLNAKMVKQWIEKIRENHKGEENTTHFLTEIAEVQDILLEIESDKIPYYTLYHVEAESYLIK